MLITSINLGCKAQHTPQHNMSDELQSSGVDEKKSGANENPWRLIRWL